MLARTQTAPFTPTCRHAGTCTLLFTRRGLRVLPKIRTQRYFNSIVPWGVRNCNYDIFSSQRGSLLCLTTLLLQGGCVK